MNFWYALAQRMPQPSRLDVAVGPLGGDIVVDTVICVIITVALLVAAAVVGTVLISRKKKKMSDGKNADEQPKEDNEK